MARTIVTPAALNRWTKPKAPEVIKDAITAPGETFVVWERDFNPDSFIARKAARESMTLAMVRARQAMPAHFGFQVQQSLGSVERGRALVTVTFHAED